MIRRWLLIALYVGVLAPIAHTQTARMELEDKYFDSNGARIRYVDVGRGDPIVLIHAFATDLDLNWGRPGIIAGLSTDFRIVALDCRGHGKSDKPHDPGSYGNKMVSDVANLLDHLGIRKAHIVGYSMGGGIAAKFVTVYPDRASTATLGGTSGHWNWTDQDEREDEELASSLEQGKGLRPLILRLAPPNEPGLSDMAIEGTSRGILGRNDPLALAAVTRSYREQVVTDDQLKAVRVPLLAVIGSADPNLRGVQALKVLLPHLQVVTIEGATHVGPPRGAPARPEFMAAVRDFVAAHATGASR